MFHVELQVESPWEPPSGAISPYPPQPRLCPRSFAGGAPVRSWGLLRVLRRWAIILRPGWGAGWDEPKRGGGAGHGHLRPEQMGVPIPPPKRGLVVLHHPLGPADSPPSLPLELQRDVLRTPSDVLECPDCPPGLVLRQLPSGGHIIRGLAAD